MAVRTSTLIRVAQVVVVAGESAARPEHLARRHREAPGGMGHLGRLAAVVAVALAVLAAITAARLAALVALAPRQALPGQASPTQVVVAAAPITRGEPRQVVVALVALAQAEQREQTLVRLTGALAAVVVAHKVKAAGLAVPAWSSSKYLTPTQRAFPAVSRKAAAALRAVSVSTRLQLPVRLTP